MKGTYRVVGQKYGGVTEFVLANSFNTYEEAAEWINENKDNRPYRELILVVSRFFTKEERKMNIAYRVGGQKYGGVTEIILASGFNTPTEANEWIRENGDNRPYREMILVVEPYEIANKGAK